MTYKVGDKVQGKGVHKGKSLNNLTGKVIRLPVGARGKSYWIEFTDPVNTFDALISWNPGKGPVYGKLPRKIILSITERNFYPFVDITYDEENWI